MTNDSRIVVVGLGYVGCVTAACFAEMGNHVVGVDQDEFKVNSVAGGKAPFFEPDLDKLIRRNVEAGRLEATTGIAGCLPQAEIVMVCVGTPSQRNGNLSLEQVQRAASEVAENLPACDRRLTIAIRSTVFPGTCEDVVGPIFAKWPAVRIVSNPEFLREGSAVEDFFDPSLVVIGAADPDSAEPVAALYRPLKTGISCVALRTAEAIKYACNGFHALKVAFANEVGTVCEKLGVSGHEVMDVLGRDTKLNISPAYLKPGFAFGGSCLPKDLRALLYRASRLDLDLPLLESVLPSNEEHVRRALRDTMELPAHRLGIYGLAFKENTDDLRESPVVALIEYLIGKGRELRVFDPRIQLSKIYGSNRSFIMSSVPHIGRLLVNDWDGLISSADALVVTQRPSPDDSKRILKSRLPILDLAGAFGDVRESLGSPAAASQPATEAAAEPHR